MYICIIQTCYLCEGDIPEGDHVAQRNPSSLKYDVSISSGVTDKNKINYRSMQDYDLFLYMVQFPHLYLKEMAVKLNRHEHNFHILKILLLEQVSLQCQITCIKRGGGGESRFTTI